MKTQSIFHWCLEWVLSTFAFSVISCPSPPSGKPRAASSFVSGAALVTGGSTCCQYWLKDTVQKHTKNVCYYHPFVIPPLPFSGKSKFMWERVWCWEIWNTRGHQETSLVMLSLNVLMQCSLEMAIITVYLSSFKDEWSFDGCHIFSSFTLLPFLPLLLVHSESLWREGGDSQRNTLFLCVPSLLQ